MKNAFLLLCLILGVVQFAHAQTNGLIQRQNLEVRFLVPDGPGPDLVRQGVAGNPLYAPAGASSSQKAQGVVPLGTASNIYTCIRTDQNQVSADNATGEVAFIHRQNIGSWGGQNGTLRYDCSFDKGQNWTRDVGPLNPAFNQASRYPNISRYKASNDSTNLIYSAATLSSGSSWDGFVSGVVCGACQPTATEHYNQLGQGTLIQGGLCPGQNGEFWVADLAYDGTNILDTLFIFKGTMGTCDISWQMQQKFQYPANLTQAGGPMIFAPNIAFSPDGMTGYAVTVGDLQGGIDSVLSPIVSMSQDGGATWTAPVEIDLSGVSWLSDTLQSLWVQEGPNSTFVPISSGKYTCTGDFDITVDKDGNLHMFNMISSGSVQDSLGVEQPTQYGLFPGLAMLLGDIHTTDGGATWDIRYIAPGMAWQDDFGAANALALENYCQISRDESGDRIFYSWVDIDSSGGLFGESDLLVPNLRIAASRVSDGFQTCWKKISDADFLLGGRILCPSMAPTVLQYGLNQGATYLMPIVSVEMTVNDPLGECQFHYWGRDALIFESEFRDPATLILADVPSSCNGGLVQLESVIPGGDVFAFREMWPQPTNSELNYAFELTQESVVQLEIMDMQGRKVAGFAPASYQVGRQQGRVDLADQLSSGMYLFRFSGRTWQGEEFSFSEKLLIAK